MKDAGGLDLFQIAVEADQVGQDIQFVTERAEVFADEIEPDLAGASGW